LSRDRWSDLLATGIAGGPCDPVDDKLDTRGHVLWSTAEILYVSELDEVTEIPDEEAARCCSSSRSEQSTVSLWVESGLPVQPRDRNARHDHTRDDKERVATVLLDQAGGDLDANVAA